MTLNDRDRLILQHRKLVHHVVWKIAAPRNLPREEVNEMIADGMVGLVDGCDRFDPDRGIAPSTLLVPRIRGSVMDGLRKRDVLSRRSRGREGNVRTTREQLSKELNRQPTELELAAEAGVSIDDLRAHVLKVLFSDRRSLDEPTDEDGTPLEGRLMGSDGRDGAGEDPQADARKIVVDAMVALNSQERFVLACYYFEEMTMAEIARTMGVTESRISQVRSKAIRKLRSRIDTMGQVA